VVLADALAGPLSSLPYRLVRTLVSVWDDTDRGAPLCAFAAAAVYEPDVARLFREMAEGEKITRIAERIDAPDANRRAAVATSQIAGLFFMRYLLGLEPLASMPAVELAKRAAPGLAAALTHPRSKSVVEERRGVLRLIRMRGSRGRTLPSRIADIVKASRRLWSPPTRKERPG
jgi:tetracycline repressor-like protein